MLQLIHSNVLPRLKTGAALFVCQREQIASAHKPSAKKASISLLCDSCLQFRAELCTIGTMADRQSVLSMTGYFCV